MALLVLLGVSHDTAVRQQVGWITLDGFIHMSWAQAGLATAELSWAVGMAESLVFFS